MWREAAVTVARGRTGLVGGALLAAGAAGVQETWPPGEAPPIRQPWDTGPAPPLPDRAVVRAWFEDPDERAVDAALAPLLAADPLSSGLLAWSDVEDVDWEQAWRAGFGRQPITGRIAIAPPWDAHPGDVVIEPGQGFGTGDHPTTRLALVALDARIQPGMRVLDVGCGSGILAIAAARLGASARGIDVDPAAVADARRNAARNGVRVPFDTTPLDRVGGLWDVVVANVHAEVLIGLRDALIRRSGSWLILGGILADREPLVRRAFDGAGTLDARDRDGDWVGLVYRTG